MKVFVTGAKGQLGSDVVKELLSRGYNTVGVDVDELNITDEYAVRKRIAIEKPDTVIHCAAWTDVDAAQDGENISTVRAVNVNGTENIARACGEIACKMVYISTDYVFDGAGTVPWTEDCKTGLPLSVYGQSKLDGERVTAQNTDRFFIVRTSWAFGKNGKNFVDAMLMLGKQKKTVNVVADQIGTPTYTYDLAKLLADLITTEKYGYYHATNEGGFISWYDFAAEIFRLASKYDGEYASVKAVPITTQEYGAKAERPLNSRLDTSKLKKAGFELLPDWRDALERYLKEVFRGKSE